MLRTRSLLGTFAAIAAAGCGGEQPGPGLAKIEQDVRVEYQSQIEKFASQRGVGEVRVEVDSVECVEKGERAASCFAKVSGDIQGQTGIDVTLGDDGSYTWETQGRGLGLNLDDAAAEGDRGSGEDRLLTGLRRSAPAVAELLVDARIERDRDITLVVTVRDSTSEAAMEDLKYACRNLRLTASNLIGQDITQVSVETDTGVEVICSL